MKIYTHPDNLPLIRELFPDERSPLSNKGLLGDFASGRLFGIEVIARDTMPRTSPRETGRYLWHEGGYSPPDDRFITYEDADIPWLLALGFISK